MEEDGKRRVIHDSIFTGEPDRKGGRWGPPVNEIISWDQILGSHLADVMLQIVRMMLGLSDQFRTRRKTLIQKEDVNCAFLQVGVEPVGAVNVGFIDRRLQFGWRRSPGGGECQPVPSNRRSDRRLGHRR